MQWQARDFLRTFVILFFVLMGPNIWAAKSIELRDLGIQAKVFKEGSSENVRVRGFLYQKNGKWILASEPNLKSCCVGAMHKKQSQLWVNSTQLPDHPPLRAVTLRGKLEEHFSDDGQVYWELAEASVEERRFKPWPWLLGTLIGVTFLGWAFWVLRRR